MSLLSVQAYFATQAPDISVIETETSSATVALAAQVHSVEPDQIAKTICLRAGDTILLLVTAGKRRLDNRKFRDHFGVKPRMLGGEEVTDITSHPIGGVCPFGLPSLIPVYCDVSLRDHAVVVPAAGAANSAVRIAPLRMAELVSAIWVDVCDKPKQPTD